MTKKCVSILRKSIRKTLKMNKIVVGLTLDEYLYQTCEWDVSLWDLLLLGSLERVLRGRKLTNFALRELKSQWWVCTTMHCRRLRCPCPVLESVRWCPYTVTAVDGWCQVFGVLKELRFGEYCGTKCWGCWIGVLGWIVQMHVMCLSLYLHKIFQISLRKGDLKFVTRGSLPWRF